MRYLMTMVALSAACFLAYKNSLGGDFVFDDHFAVTQNRDVLMRDAGQLKFLENDFWGQPLKSDSSHKSYRPLTVLWFRLLGAIGRVSTGTDDVDASREETEQSPFSSVPFHVANITLHAVATCLVFWLTLISAAARERLTIDLAPEADHSHEAQPSSNPLQLEVAAAPPAGSSVRLRGIKTKTIPQDFTTSDSKDEGNKHLESKAGAFTSSQPLKFSDASPAVACEAHIAAALFAWHPIHTEAVAGIVGLAEVLCAVLFLSAILIYGATVEWLCAGGGRPPTLASRLKTAALAVAIAATVFSAAFAKELGITVVVSMLLYDLLLAPHIRATRRRPGRLVWRAGMLLSAVLLYVGVRHMLMGGQQLVMVFRKVENPIAFETSLLARMLSTGHLHARYAWLLVSPWRLSADYSHACIPLLRSLNDPRNAFTAALYGLLIWQLLCDFRPASKSVAAALGLSAPLPCRQRRIPDDGRSSSSGRHLADSDIGQTTPAAAAAAEASAYSEREAVAIWRVFVVVGLIIAPFVPSSNVLLYVGTFIGERLLYLPSIGFCMLIAQAAVAATGGVVIRARQTKRPVRTMFVGLCLVALLGAYLTRTVTRNRDWSSEETLFVSAARVCPNSAKVQLNSAILMRRQSNWDAALKLLDRAQAIEPTYCEADFWRGLTMLNSNRNVRDSLAMLERGVKCRHTEHKSLQALNQAFLMLQGTSFSQDVAFMANWGRILAAANRTTEACGTFERQAAGLLDSPSQRSPADRVELGLKLTEMCVTATKRPEGAISMVHSSTQQHAESLRLLGKCARWRGAARHELLLYGSDSQQALRGVHVYLEEATGRCRGTLLPLVAVDEPPPPHTLLVHTVQLQHPTDPWLQEEWATILANEGRGDSALAHFKAAALLFSGISVADPLPLAPVSLMTGAGQLSIEQRLAAVLRCFASAQQSAPSGDMTCNLQLALRDTLDAMLDHASFQSTTAAYKALIAARSNCSAASVVACRDRSTSGV